MGMNLWITHQCGGTVARRGRIEVPSGRGHGVTETPLRRARGRPRGPVRRDAPGRSDNFRREAWRRQGLWEVGATKNDRIGGNETRRAFKGTTQLSMLAAKMWITRTGEERCTHISSDSGDTRSPAEEGGAWGARQPRHACYTARQRADRGPDSPAEALAAHPSTPCAPPGR